MRWFRQYAHELRKPQELKVGDRVLIEAVVTSIKPAVPGGKLNHIHAVPAEDELWMSGDQYLWTWGWTQASGRKVKVLR